MHLVTARRLSVVIASAALSISVVAPASFTPPIGTDKGSLTAPLGSNKGSAVDARPPSVFSGDAYDNEMG